jgi:hypothetical protein
MLTYDTRLPEGTAIPPGMRDEAIRGLTGRSPFASYGQNHQDVFGYMGAAAADEYARAASRANTAYDAQRLATQQGLALAGLQQMSQAQQNDAALGNSRLSMMTGLAGNLLGGLFR